MTTTRHPARHIYTEYINGYRIRFTDRHSFMRKLAARLKYGGFNPVQISEIVTRETEIVFD